MTRCVTSVTQCVIALTWCVTALLGGGNLDGLPNAEQEEESTSGVSTYDSTRREHECAHYDNRELYGQLQNIEEENRRWGCSVVESCLALMFFTGTLQGSQNHSGLQKICWKSGQNLFLLHPGQLTCQLIFSPTRKY